MKEFVKKMGIVFIFCVILIIISGVTLHLVLENHSNYEASLRDQERYQNRFIADFKRRGSMIAYGEKGLSIEPRDAFIENGIIHVQGLLKNNSGAPIKLKDYGILNKDFGSAPFHTNYEFETILAHQGELDVEFLVGAYDLMSHATDFPGTMKFMVGGTNTYSNNYEEYALTFYISWLYDQVKY